MSSISTFVVDSLSDLGFPLPPKPVFDIPSLPREITELDDEALMSLFVEFTQWNAHLAGAHAIACINEREAERSLELGEAEAIFSSWTSNISTKGMLASVLKAKVSSLPAIRELHQDLNIKYAFRKVLETRTISIERDSQLVSRELTRRTSDGGGMRSRTRRFTT